MLDKQILKRFGVEGNDVIIKRGSVANLLQQAPFFMPYHYRHTWSGGEAIEEEADIIFMFKNGKTSFLERNEEWTTGDGREMKGDEGQDLRDCISENVVAVLFHKQGNEQGKEWEEVPELWIINNENLNIQKIRRRIEDFLRKTDKLTILKTAIALNVKLD